MDILFETIAFAAKGGIVFITILLCVMVISSLANRKAPTDGHLEIKRLNDSLRMLRESLRAHMMPPKEFKKHFKSQNKALKKADGKDKKVFVLDFDGDLQAHAVDRLRHEVSSIVGVAGEDDEVIVRVESPGGVVHGYGLAASQLVRIKDRKIKLTVCVDKVAASGGYMMACVADEIIAAPFAILGSIGVAAPVPNFHKLLGKHGVEYDEMTAGEYKRTVSMFGEITDKGRKKFQEQLDDTHLLFKSWVGEKRPSLDIDSVATGEYWHGIRALELGLADTLQTSDDYLLAKLDEADIFQVTYKEPENWREKFAGMTGQILERGLSGLWARIEKQRFV